MMIFRSLVPRLCIVRIPYLPRYQITTQQKERRSELATYLEIIPPVQTYRIVEAKNKLTQTLLAELKGRTELTKEQQLQVEKHLIKNAKFLTVSQIKEVFVLATTINNSAPLSKLFRKVLSRLERHVEVLQLPDLIDIVYQLAKLNRKEAKLMKAVEDRIIEEPLKIHFPTLRKALFAYAHLNMGCATLYSSIARTIKIGQHELEPLELTDLANLFSRVQDNAEGGFGTFRIAEARLEAVIQTLPYQKLVLAAEHMLTQNLGSNNLQTGLEQYLYKKFPQINREFSISKLVRLLKSVSGYYFKFNEGCLQQLLENATLKTVSHMSVEQLEATVWSWGRSSRGSKELWEKLQFHMINKIKLLNNRGVCFGYWAFSRAPHRMDEVMDLLEKHYQKITDNHLHYDIKMLQGMPKRHPINQQLFSESCRSLIDRIGQLGSQDFMRLLAVMNQSDIDYQHQQATKIAEALHASENKLLQTLPFYRPSQLVDILYLWVKMNIKSQPFMQRISEQLSDLNSIPKKAFLKAMFAFVMRDQYDKVFEMLKIIYLLREFGPIGYFFPPGEYPLLAYTVFHVVVNGRSQSGERLFVENWLTAQLIEYLDKLEPGILNSFELKAYTEARNLIAKWQQST